MGNRNFTFKMMGLLTAACCVFMMAGCGGRFVPIPYRSLAPFKGKVVDTDTKEPIDEAAVLAVYYVTEASIMGSNSYVVDGQDTVTDKNGEFKLPRKRRWFVLQRGYPRGKLIIFKPGYGAFPRHQRSVAVEENKGWPPSGKHIVCELPKLSTKEERRRKLPGAYSFDEIPYTQQEKFIKTINKEAIDLGISPYPLPEKENGK